MTTEIKQVRYKPGEKYPFAFCAEYPFFIVGSDALVAPRGDAPAPRGDAPVPHGDAPAAPRDDATRRLNIINTATEQFIEAAGAVRQSAGVESVTVTHYIYHRDDKLISFVLDVQHRSGEGLLFLRRFCFNWDVRGGTLIPLSEVTRYHKKLMRENMLHSLNDYSLAPDTLFIQRSTFTREGGARCRRSQYKKFLTTVPYDLRALRGGTRDSGGKDDLKNDVFSGIML